MPNLSTTEYKMVSEIFNRCLFWEEKIRKQYAQGTPEDRSRAYAQHVIIMYLKAKITTLLEE